MDTRTPEQRRQIMQSVGQKDTAPELIVRRLIHRLGFRFRLHRKDLAGKPDIVLPRLRKVIFVHGCYWHGHEGCPKGRLPKSRSEYWAPKIMRNKERDTEAVAQLLQDGWRVFTVWQCETHDTVALTNRLRKFLETS